MKTLIIPCAGRNFVNDRPRWTLYYPPKDILLSKCLKTIGAAKYDRIIVTLIREDLKYISEEEIRQLLDVDFELYLLDAVTNGPAETVYKTIKAMKVFGTVHIKDIDIIFSSPDLEQNNFISGIHLLNYESELSNVKNKSFITRNEQNVVLDIIEKTIKSDIISIGLYGFNDAMDFVNAYEQLIKSFVFGEVLYISHVISYLIAVENKVFNYYEVPQYESVETEKEYEKTLRRKGLLIIDTSKVRLDKHLHELKFMKEKGSGFIYLTQEEEFAEIRRFTELNGIAGQMIRCNSKVNKKMISSDEELKDVYISAM